MLNVSGLTKRFGGFTALEAVDFTLLPGEVHALLGENGAGKSTLINAICGTFPPSEGNVQLDGRSLLDLSPLRVREVGVAPVFQEFSLAPALSVLDNLFLGREATRGPFLRRGEMRREAEALLSRIGFSLPLDEKVSRLSRAQKQMVEIAKALRLSPKILILDEPTASLTDGEAEKLFEAVARLKAQGVGILYVSHRMAEIRRLSDRVTVLRGGRLIATVHTADVTDAELIEMMVGRPVDELFPEIHNSPGAPALRVSDLSTATGSIRAASIEARKGEVIGLAGLVGCGRSELCRAIFGLEDISSGEVVLGETPVAKPRPDRMIAAGICYFPGDRAAEGLALNRPARENVSMAGLRLRKLSRGGLLRAGAEPEVVAGPLDKLGLRPMMPERRAGAFSGGNQQKVMLARGLVDDFDVYLFDEPTVGIDVGAKTDVYRFIKQLAESGACVIVSTSELPELLHLSDRIYVMAGGAVVQEIARDEASETAILSHYFGE
ncbi:sugar ABC transporter ATP-binding protein [Salipiger bermudensis]|uniref:sugar ABC transporter ATP-binding protein n=1 Tax=Salipiger bermudensis TaxID=344736 RepID=UPI001C98EAD0|nr:sugar ABC transporter ATP-binding protein [Salipiger bermudensis]MBY6005298.1 sugar ABC transporter ATP-binding protein [Salipiger bermudensis]